MKMIMNLSVLVLVFGCISPDNLSKTLKENPKILSEAIKANPVEFLEAVQEAAKLARPLMEKKRAEVEEKRLENTYKNPYQPLIRSDELIRGPKNAPLTLVEYSDFECPFCTKGFETVLKLLKIYEGKMRFIYKHLPLSFHDKALIASQYYEAIRLQSGEKAIKFHDLLFKSQAKLRQGESFLKSIARKVGANMSRLKKDIKSAKVLTRIDQDRKEAAKFGFQGTPGFLLNGIPVKGAYPVAHFQKIVEKLKEMGKVRL